MKIDPIPLLSQHDWLKRVLAEYLLFDDALNMSQVCKHSRLLKSSSPQALPLTKFHCIGHWEVYTPFKCVELPISIPTVHIHSVILTGKWKDQGWGNRKGMLSIVKGNGRAPDDYQPPSQDVLAYVEPSPHEYEHFELAFYPSKYSPDEKYSLWVRVGGGGGHELEVKDLSMRYLLHASYEDDNNNEILPADNINDHNDDERIVGNPVVPFHPDACGKVCHSFKSDNSVSFHFRVDDRSDDGSSIESSTDYSDDDSYIALRYYDNLY